MARIGFLGTGEIASAMVSTIAEERNAKISAELAQGFDAVDRAPNGTVVERSDLVILCLLAGVARDILPLCLSGKITPSSRLWRACLLKR